MHVHFPPRARYGLFASSLAGIAVIGSVLLTPVLLSCATDSSTGKSGSVPAENQALAAAQMVERGHYLMTVGACNDCHTPWKMGPSGPEPDMDRMLSGHPEDFPVPAELPEARGPWAWHGTATNTAFAGPWGISFAANLTPDANTGLGSWTEEWFIESLRTGKHWGRGRDIMPPMPWPAYGKMTDEDLKSVFAYLKSIPPIRNNVTPWIPPSAATRVE